MSYWEDYKIVVESKNNKLYIYYEKSALYCKIISPDGSSKETLLINGIYDDYCFSKSQQGNVYLLCHSRNNNYMLLSYNGDVWRIEELDFEKDSINIIPLGVFALSTGIHIVFAKKLLLENYYDLYLLENTHNEWKKSFICEIYSKTLGYNQIIRMTEYNNLHMICTFFDGNTFSLNYFTYDSKTTKWSNTPIVNLNQKKVYVYLSASNNNLNLFCYNYNDRSSNIFYFSKELDLNSYFKLIDIIKIRPIEKDIPMYFEVLNESLNISYIWNKQYYYKEYYIKTKKWMTSKAIPLYQLSHLHWVKTEGKDIISSINDDLELLLPIEMKKIENKHANEKNKKTSDETSIILEHISSLTEKIEKLNSKLNLLEENKAIKSVESEQIKEELDNKNHPILKKTNFKERFMQSKPTTLKLENTTLLSGNNHYVKVITPNSKEIKKNDTSPDIKIKNAENKKGPEQEPPAKTKNIIKTVTDWFKG